MKIIKRLKSRLFWFRHWLKWTCVAIKRMHEWNSDILSASAEVEHLRDQIEEQRREIKTLEYKLDSLDIDVESTVEDYLNYHADLSDHIDFEDVSEKTLAMMVHKLAEHV